MRFLSAAAVGLALIVSTPAVAQHGNGHGHKGHDEYGRGDWHGGRNGHYDNGWHGRRNASRHYYYSRGYRFDRGYRGWSRYDGLPPAFRHRYRYDPHYRYVYRDNVVYIVDPTTRLVRDVVDLLRY